MCIRDRYNPFTGFLLNHDLDLAVTFSCRLSNSTSNSFWAESSTNLLLETNSSCMSEGFKEIPFYLDLGLRIFSKTMQSFIYWRPMSCTRAPEIGIDL